MVIFKLQLKKLDLKVVNECKLLPQKTEKLNSNILRKKRKKKVKAILTTHFSSKLFIDI